jgi:hypothetical protein
MCDLLVYSLIIPVIPFQLQALGYSGVPALVGWLLFAFVGLRHSVASSCTDKCFASISPEAWFYVGAPSITEGNISIVNSYSAHRLVI